MYYLCVDFESTNQKGCWWAYGCMLASYPSGEVLHRLESYCRRQDSDFDEETREFWNKYPESQKRLTDLAHEFEQGKEEIRICEFIRYITDTYPGVTIVSDNPQFDLRMLDNILTKHDFPVCGKRKDRYSRSISTLSFCHGVKSVIGNYTYNMIKAELSSINPRRQVDLYQGTPHCPLYDCATILSAYFKAMDIARHYNTYKFKTI
jgi:hypothetical protein